MENQVVFLLLFLSFFKQCSVNSVKDSESFPSVCTSHTANVATKEPILYSLLLWCRENQHHRYVHQSLWENILGNILLMCDTI